MNVADLGEVTPVPQVAPARAPADDASSAPLNITDIGPVQSQEDFNEDKYGGLGQQALTGLEGAAKGLAGPLATATEVGLGVNPEDIRNRAETNPVTHGLSEAAGFAAPLLLSGGVSAEARAALEAAQGTSALAKASQYTVPGLVSKLGEAAASATGLGGVGASTISKIAASGIKTGAEMAALQGGDEVSKLITNDPNMSIGQSAINIGLSGLIGGAGGAIIGSVSPLWKSLTGKAGIPEIIDDAKAQYDFRQKNPDVPSAMADELTNRMQEVDNMRAQTQNLKGDAIAQAMPEMHQGIADHVQGIIDSFQEKINKMRSDEYTYPKRLTNKLQSDLDNYRSSVTVKPDYMPGGYTPPPEPDTSFSFGENAKPETTSSRGSSGSASGPTENLDNVSSKHLKYALQHEGINPDTGYEVNQDEAKKVLARRADSAGEDLANSEDKKYRNLQKDQPLDFNDAAPQVAPDQLKSPVEIFNATQDLKRTMQEYSKFDKLVTPRDEGYDFIKTAKGLSHDLRVGLEDPKVWGKAGTIQRDTNAAISKQIGAIKDFGKKFTSSVMGENVADPDKIRSFINTIQKGKGKVKSDIFSNYLKHTNELADTLNDIHTKAGLDPPISLTPTSAINHTLENTSKGTNLGNWMYDKGLGNLVGHGTAEATGAGLGALVGHPMIGAYLGEKAMGPVFSSIAKPLMETATNSAGAKTAIDYVASVMKGDKLLNTATQNIFKAGAEILPQKLMPDDDSRAKLETSLKYAQNPQNMMNVGGNLGHYLPMHQTAAAATTATAVNYLNNLKPKTIQQNPLDRPLPPDKAQLAKYNRALDVAQQPLVVIDHVKKGTLQAGDVQALNTMYPSLHKKIVDSLAQNMMQATSEGHSIPYHQRASLGLLMGKPLDSTNTQMAMQAAMMANGGAKTQTQGQQQPHGRSPNSQTIKAVQKNADLYQTPSQARATSKLKS